MVINKSSSILYSVMSQKSRLENGFKHPSADTFKKPPLYHKDLSSRLHDFRQGIEHLQNKGLGGSRSAADSGQAQARRISHQMEGRPFWRSSWSIISAFPTKPPSPFLLSKTILQVHSQLFVWACMFLWEPQSAQELLLELAIPVSDDCTTAV